MRPKCCLPQRINNFFRKKESFMNIFVGFCFFSNEIFLDEGHLKVERTDIRGLAPVTLYIIHINVFNALSSIREKKGIFPILFSPGNTETKGMPEAFSPTIAFSRYRKSGLFFQICICLHTFKLCICVCNAVTYSPIAAFSKYRRSNLFSLSPSHQTVGE